MSEFLSLVIPFYNEEENVQKCVADHIKALSNAGIAFEILAVNNGSWDKTGEILRSLGSPFVKVVTVKKNKGFGYGIKQGLSIAKGNYLSYDAGDNEVDANAVAKIFKKLVDENLDLCKGYRISRAYSFFRKLESWTYNVLVRLILGYKLGDVNGYPKVMTRECYNAVKPNHNDGFFDAEMLARAMRKGCKISSVPVHYRERVKGKSKMNLHVPIENLRAMLKFKLDLMFGRVK